MRKFIIKFRKIETVEKEVEAPTSEEAVDLALSSDEGWTYPPNLSTETSFLEVD